MKRWLVITNVVAHRSLVSTIPSLRLAKPARGGLRYLTAQVWIIGTKLATPTGSWRTASCKLTRAMVFWFRRLRMPTLKFGRNSGSMGGQQWSFPSLFDPQKVTADNAYEVNIFDKRPDPAYGTGAIVNVSKPSAFLKAADH